MNKIKKFKSHRIGLILRKSGTIKITNDKFKSWTNGVIGNHELHG